ncbi:MAG: GNAT family N-acetyltransferase [bacterium]|nr:GNAT family N-acetyltransferase [bacterium]
MADIKIRKPTRGEYNQIVRVVNSETTQYKRVLTQQKLEGIGIGKFLKKDLMEGEKTRSYIVAIKKVKIVGFASWYIKPNKIAWVSMLEVLPKYQQRGIGASLLKSVEKIAKKRKARAVVLEVQKKAHWAITFYKKMGYKILSKRMLIRKLFVGTLVKPPVKATQVFGKIFF